MNWEQIEGHWKEMKGRAHEKWGKLTDDDLARIDGRRTQLVGLVQQRYGKAKEAVEREVDSWMDSLTAATGSAAKTGSGAGSGTSARSGSTTGASSSAKTAAPAGKGL